MMSAGENKTSPADVPLSQEPHAAHPSISRRAALRRIGILTGGAAVLVTAEACGATLWALYTPQTERFGGPLIVGRKTDFPAALPQACTLDTAGVFYRREARAFLVHLSSNTDFLLKAAKR